MLSVILKNVRQIDPAAGTDRVADFIVRDGVIQPRGHGLNDGKHSGRDESLRVIDAEGLIVAPGFWDVHVHFRDPGNPAAETRRTGSQAAAAGGFTHVVTMPNTVPAGDSPAWLREQIEDPSLSCRILPSACVTQDRKGEKLSDIPALIKAGAAAFTDDGAMVFNDALMRQAMSLANSADKPVMDHAVVPKLMRGGVIRDCPAARKYNLPIFPPEAEVEAVRRDIGLCSETGCRTDIQHLSCAESVALIRAAQRKGVRVTGEATPHHLAIAAEDIPGDDGNFRMNPPLGNRADLRAIRDGVLDGTLKLFATDHAPHTTASKAQGFLKAPFGIIGLETAIGVTWKIMVEEEGLPILRWAAMWTTGPAELLGLPAPSLAPGRAADFVLLDARTPWTVRPEMFRSLSRNTPFAGWALPVRAVMTVCEGRETYCGPSRI